MENARSARPWPTYALAGLCVAAIVAAVLVVGPASGSQPSTGRTIAAAQGVVQTTVSGSGNIQSASQLDLGFKTSGVVTRILVSQGQHVVAGQLLAELDPKSAEVTLEQAKASLQAAEASLAAEEETDGEASSGQASTGGSDASKATASAAGVDSEDISYDTTTGPTGPTGAAPATTTPAPTTATPPTRTTTAQAPAAATPTQTAGSTHTGTTPARSTVRPTRTTAAPTRTAAATPTQTTTTPAAASKTTLSAATREANIASARAAVKSDKLTVQSDEEALSNTKLYAPQDGTIVSLSGEVGETVSGSGTTKGSTSSASSGSSGSDATGTGSAAASAFGASSAAGGSSSSADSSGSGSSSSTSFAVLSDLSSMQLVVPLSESEVGSVKVGQPATVTIEALESRKVAAEVVSVATLPTSTSGVVSYDVTFQLNQLESGLKPGMSATAEVVVKQAEGVNVPTTAITADTVTVVEHGKQVRRRVVTGLAGNDSTIVLSGLKAGEEIVLPVARSTTASSLTSRLGSRTGGAGLGAAAGGLGGGGGGAAFLGGGGGFRGG
jgi:multidrug efflux pump subunit AcrA (membrane-fusion protein)